MKDDKFKVLSQEYILRTKWMNVRMDALELPDGKVIPDFYVLELPDWVNVIAITRDGKIILEHQYRHGLGRTSWELPGGCLEKTDASPLEGAKRELLEETGYGGGEWEALDTLCGNPANSNNLMHCFVARGVELLANQSLDDGEYFEVKAFSREHVLDLLQRGEFVHALHAAPLWKYFALHGWVAPSKS